jgi:rhamnose transport system ATP-binding protein
LGGLNLKSSLLAQQIGIKTSANGLRMISAEMTVKIQEQPEIGQAVLGLSNATKAFGGTVALRDASFELRAGEVLALLGENGAGKSTCVKLMAGVYWPTLGSVTLDGRPVQFNSALDAQNSGIAVMHQHPGLFPDLSIAENVFMGHLPMQSMRGLDKTQMVDEAARILASVGLNIDPRQKLAPLRTSEQQLVEIARALSLKARVLIMDEPTAALSQREVKRLFAVVDLVRSQGTAIMFVGHRMDEIFSISDRIAVLRDGVLVGVESAANLPRDRAIQMMVGRELSSLYPKSNADLGKTVLQTHKLSSAGQFENIDLEVRAGEIVGIGGLVGSGRTELARVLFGIKKPTGGTIEINGNELAFTDPKNAMEAGIAYVSEDRLGQSLVPDFSILDNSALTILERAKKGIFFSGQAVLSSVREHLDRLKLKFSSYDQGISTLSGGNQQKVVLAKWLATKPKLLILDEPTQGIDVQSKAEVHAMIADLARQGMAIILISSEMPELLGMCDRIVVLREGRKTAEFSRAEATQEKVLKAATDAENPAKHLRTAGNTEPNKILAQNSEQVALAKKPKAVPFWAKRELGLIFAMLAVVIPVAFINPRIFGSANMTAVAMDAALLSVVALAQLLVLVTRNIDLSVASIIGLSAYGSASLMATNPSLGIAAGLLWACAIGMGAGLLNGLVITIGRVPAIVVTLGTMSIYRGLNSLWASGRQISADQVTQSWLDMTSAQVFGIPYVILIAIAILAISAWLLSNTKAGRELFAIGSNPSGAALIGIPVNRQILLAYVIAGALAGFTGALWASRYATIDARVAYGYELTVIAAAVVGGVAIRGGAGTVLGIALGALTLLVVRNGLTLVRVDPLWLQGVYGLVILAAITIDAWVARRALAASVSKRMQGDAS